MMGRLLLILCVMLLSSNAGGGQGEDLELIKEKVAIQNNGWILHHPDKRRSLQSVKRPKRMDGIHILATTNPKQDNILVAGRRYDPKDSVADYLTSFTVSDPDSHNTEPSVLVEADTSYLGDPVFSMQTIIKTTATLAIPDSAAMRFVIKESYRDSVIADEIIGFDERSADGSFVYTLSIIMDFPVNFKVTAQAYVFTVNRWTYWSIPISVRYDSRRSQGGMGQTQPPSDFALAPIYPNPLSIGNGLQVAHISFHLPEKARVRIAVYNLLGQEIIRLLEDNAIMPAGRHTVTWQAQDQFGNPFPAGICLIRMVSNKFVDQRKLVVIR